MFKKQFTLISLMILWAGAAWGQTEIFNHSGGGAEPSGWTFTNNVSTNPVDKGSYWVVDSGSPSDIITTVSYDLSAYTNAEFKVDITSFGSGTHNAAKIEFSFNGGSTFTQIELTPITTSNYVTSGQITLNSVSSQVVLRISNNGTSGRGVRLKNLILTAVNTTTPVVVIASASQITASSKEQNTDNVLISFFDLTVSDATATLSSLSVTSDGNYVAGDIKTGGFKLWMDSDATFEGASQIGTSLSSTAAGSGETLNFTSLAKSLAVGTHYFWVTANIAASATVSHTLSIDAIANTDFTFTAATKSGSASAGGTITVSAATVPIIVVSTTSLTDFGTVIKGSTSGEDSFTVSADNLTDNVTITAPTGFKVSTTSGSGFGESAILTQVDGDLDDEPVTVYVRFAPIVAEGSTSGNITVASSKGIPEFVSKNVSISGKSLDIEPTTQASAAIFSNTTANTFDISWTKGNGANVIVLLKSGSAVDSNPVDATNYTANTAFSSGTQIGTGNYVVYKGTGTSVSVTGLSSATTYHAAVYGFNEGTGTSQNYYTTSPATASQLTSTPVQPKLIISQYYEGASNDKYLEITNIGSSVADLSTVSLALWSNTATPSGAPNSNVTLTGTLATGASVIYKNSSAANPSYASSAGISSSAANFNGNDPIAILFDGSTWADRIDCIYSGAAGDWGADKSFVRKSNITSGSTAISVLDGSGEWTEFTLVQVSNATATDVEYLGFHSVSPSIPTREITGAAGWRMLSAPITGFKVADISDNTAIQGVVGGDNPTLGSNFFTFGSSGAYSTPADINTPFGDGYGFITKFYNNSLGGSAPLPLTLSVSGSEPSSNVVTNLNKTISLGDDIKVYYTMLGNPFASNIKLSSLSVNNSGSLSGSVKIWDNSLSDYADVIVSSGVLAPWQGFWAYVLESDGATQITYPLSAKTSDSSTGSYFKKAVNSFEGHFTLGFEDKVSHPFRVLLHENAQLGFDIYDSFKFTPMAESYAILGGNQTATTGLKSIESLPVEISEIVELSISPQIVGKSGEFSLNWSQFDAFPSSLSLQLLDSETGLTYDLRQAGSIPFALETIKKISSSSQTKPQIAQSESNRFKVQILPMQTSLESDSRIPQNVSLAQNFPNPFNPSTQIAFTIPEQSMVSLRVFDMLGRQVSELVHAVKAAGKYEINFNASELSSGMYIYRLETNGAVLTKKMTLIK